MTHFRVGLSLLFFIVLYPPIESNAMWNIPFPTLGGKQFWADERVYSGWRIQRHVLTGHSRLLDRRDVRWEWGSRKACEEKFAKYQLKGKIPQPGTDVVIVLHGLLRAKESMNRMEKALAAEGYEVVNVNYPSYFGKVERHADQLDRIVQDLNYATRIHFVTHSMGGIVVRAWLLNHEDQRIGRAVMIAPPSNGSGMADLLDKVKILRPVFGPAAKQLRTAENGGMTAAYGQPKMDVGVIAGGRDTRRGYNRLLKGDNDFVVEVDNAKLDGSKDFLLVEHSHTFIMAKKKVIEETVNFLKTGCFGHQPTN